MNLNLFTCSYVKSAVEGMELISHTTHRPATELSASTVFSFFERQHSAWPRGRFVSFFVQNALFDSEVGQILPKLLAACCNSAQCCVLMLLIEMGVVNL